MIDRAIGQVKRRAAEWNRFQGLPSFNADHAAESELATGRLIDSVPDLPGQ